MDLQQENLLLGDFEKGKENITFFYKGLAIEYLNFLKLYQIIREYNEYLGELYVVTNRFMELAKERLAVL